MADLISTAGAGVAAGAMGAATSGLPPTDVLVWAVIGGLVALWLEHQAEHAITPRWVLGSLAHIFVSAASGVALSAGAIAVAPAFAWLHPLGSVPRWVMAAVIAALIHKVGPWALGRARDVFERRGGRDHAA